ncbi:hypothetical protein ANCDUO_16765 [Ancylostoma duodenale]|uniref:Uncharacterized protein n=1 Tax=Ancylostoma duodenale TaxID=51022 RepID=A0A0C2C9Z7_9BILA|nr:hypothetical protein ANCDUO_16765 [Ancylostoma duodenale]
MSFSSRRRSASCGSRWRTGTHARRCTDDVEQPPRCVARLRGSRAPATAIEHGLKRKDHLRIAAKFTETHLALRVRDPW